MTIEKENPKGMLARAQRRAVENAERHLRDRLFECLTRNPSCGSVHLMRPDWCESSEVWREAIENLQKSGFDTKLDANDGVVLKGWDR